jgi:hypothetical protein
VYDVRDEWDVETSSREIRAEEKGVGSGSKPVGM